ncbi:Hypothetical protein NTJ_14862 [Nesidiocoris tenuis]|uniref:Uncharacterized protein n=1 Tax=Nesidiocoris tenuis TaxID=355587 RepID=A0ABN7BCE2_9HEMI|nr:Hypothetical protein NTJ_14862 [Nesidiocoris tenuis]
MEEGRQVKAKEEDKRHHLLLRLWTYRPHQLPHRRATANDDQRFNEQQEEGTRFGGSGTRQCYAAIHREAGTVFGFVNFLFIL